MLDTTETRQRSIYQPEQDNLTFPAEPTFVSVTEERQHRKERLVACCRAFAMHGLDYGFAGHLTVRDPASRTSTGQIRWRCISQW